MAKAHIRTPEGIDVKLEGTPQEIAAVLKDAKGKAKAGDAEAKKTKAPKSAKITIPTLVEELKQEGFFKKPKTLGEIKKRLAELGHNYAITTLSGGMQGQAKKRTLRRFKEKGKKYVYAQ